MDWMDLIGGPLYVGSGCFHRRESLYGTKYESNKAEMKYNKRNTRADASTLEEKAKSLITCTFEDNTEWGKEVIIFFFLFISLYLPKLDPDSIWCSKFQL